MLGEEMFGNWWGAFAGGRGFKGQDGHQSHLIVEFYIQRSLMHVNARTWHIQIMSEFSLMRNFYCTN